jgi:hypothetical protein
MSSSLGRSRDIRGFLKERLKPKVSPAIVVVEAETLVISLLQFFLMGLSEHALRLLPDKLPFKACCSWC